MDKMYKVILLVILLSCVITQSAIAHDSIIIATWNIEYLGSGGRGFGDGFGKGNIPKRTKSQLHKIADFIKNDLKSDVLAVQEIAITSVKNNQSRSKQLDTITKRLGSHWEYYLPLINQDDIEDDIMFVGLIWNNQRVNKLNIYTLDVPLIELARAPLYSRKPVIGHFEAIKDGNGTNDFVLVNVHLKSGQDYDENHIIAITHIESTLTKSLKVNQIKESERIILGDFNDNPYKLKSNGKSQYSTALYQHMEYKKYIDLVTSDFHSTRMDKNLTSVIDNILISNSAKRQYHPG